MRYSILDIFRKPLESTEVARQADRLGFHRYWVGEHHDSTQCPNPVLLGAVLLGLTEQIRVGTGALGLLARSPLTVAEDVRIINALFGDRFDLGVSPGLVGGSPSTRDLLLDGRDATLLKQAFPERIRRLSTLLANGPAGAGMPSPLWLVGRSAYTAHIAASLGLGFCTSLYHARSIADLDAALATYREAFRPGQGLTEPYTILVQSGVCAASDQEAQAAIRAFFLVGDSDAHFKARPVAAWLFAGGGDSSRQRIEAAISRFRPDEIMIHNLLFESMEREIQSLELLAAALGLERLP